MTVTQGHRRLPSRGARRRVLGMIIAARRRRVLSRTEYVLRRTDPRLSSKFGMFSRLNSAEEMPWVERVPPGSFRRAEMNRIGQLTRRLGVVVCVAAAAAALVTVLLAWGGASARCVPAKAAHDAALSMPLTAAESWQEAPCAR